jgi:hypothetical protein
VANIDSNLENSSRFIKIPKALCQCSPAEAQLYAAFLDFKAWNPEGIITSSSMIIRRADRHFYGYWMTKLVRRGWATERITQRGKIFSLKAYQDVWRDMGVQPSWCRKIKRYKFVYSKVDVADLPLERKEYIRKLKDLLLSQVAGNKVRQIKYRLRTTQSPVTDKTATYISSRAISELFLLRSSRSGHKYRLRFFEVIPEPPILLRFPDGTCRNFCKRIAL